MPALRDLPLREQAYQRLKQLILDEVIPPNTFLSERGLAEELGMSKTPIRLALARLESEGFVRVSPQQGIVVLALSFEEVLEHIDYRLALESFVVRQLAGRLSPAQTQALEAELAQQQQILEKPDQPQFVAADMAFHRHLAQLLGNRQILQAIERQQDMLYRIASRVYHKHPQRRAESLAEHRQLVAYLASGQQAEALELIERHIRQIKHLLVG